MKHMKKLAGLALALVMLAALAVPAMAVVVSIDKQNNDHDLYYYKIFDIPTPEDDTKSLDLSKATWSTTLAANGKAAIITALQTEFATEEWFKDLTADASAAEVAGIIAANCNPDKSSNANRLATAFENAFAAGAWGAFSSNEDPDDRYGEEVKPTGTKLPDNVATGYYLIRDELAGKTVKYMVQAITEDTTVTVKTTTSGSEKKVWDPKVTTADKWSDTAVYEINEEIPFKLSAPVPDAFATVQAGQKFPMVFHDFHEDGLTVDTSSIKIYLNSITDANEIKLREAVTINTSPTPHADDEDANIAGKTCDFEVTVDLAALSSLGIKPNDQIIVTYKAKLNENATFGENGVENTVVVDTNGTFSTPDTVEVYTFKFVVNKVDANNTPLAGAGFTLYKYVPLEESETAPEGMEANKGTEAGKWVVFEEIGAADDRTEFEFKGLKDGWYKLVESTCPEDYNPAADSYFLVKSSTTNNPRGLTELKAEATDETCSPADGDAISISADKSQGSMTTSVLNLKGNVLPSTGGIGTTIFYIVGGVLVAAAAILLITKRRMKLNED